MNEQILGTCVEMCPEQEMILREQERLLHVLEMVNGTEKHAKPKAHRKRMVKAFSRSAAGQTMQTPKNLRTPDALLQTVNYLLFDIITVETLPWHVIYDFIMDRLHAVRQDMVIQRLSVSHSISILQPIVRFYAYAAYRSCEKPTTQYDPEINNKHLQECLKKLLVLYDECDMFSYRSNTLKNSLINIDQYDELYVDDRPYMEGLYVIFNLGDTTALTRALRLPKKWKSPVVNQCLQISLYTLQGNWVRVCRLIYELPTILAGIAALHLPTIRRFCFRKALQSMSVAYNSKNVSFPAEELKYLFLYSKMSNLVLDCKHYNISCHENNNEIYFLKGAFDDTKKTCSPKYEAFVTEKLIGRTVPSLVLYGDLS